MIIAAPRRVLVYEPDDLVPKRLMPRETGAMLKGMRDAVEPAIVTLHVQGSDLILRTLEYVGDRLSPSVPGRRFHLSRTRRASSHASGEAARDRKCRRAR